MIKQICPHCLRAVSVPDDAAGKEVTCPECGKAFQAPARYTPAVVPDAPAAAPPTGYIPPVPAAVAPGIPGYIPPAPPGYIPPVPPSTQMEPPLPAAPPVPPAPPGYTHSRGITFSPRVVAWVPAVCLTLALLMTFFTWVGSYVGGHAIYAQGPWRAMAGRVWQNVELEQLVRSQALWLDRVRSDWELMLPYLVCLILATAFAWAERLVAKLDRARLPGFLQWVTAVWPYRVPVIAGLASLALALVLVQAATGFGLERALKTEVQKQFAEERQLAGNSQAENARIDFREEQEYAKYHITRTAWLYLALACQILAVLAIALRASLEARGNTKPPPRIVLQY